MADSHGDRKHPSSTKATRHRSRSTQSASVADSATTATVTPTDESPEDNKVRFLCRCGKLVRGRDVEAVRKRRCPTCGTSFDRRPEQRNQQRQSATGDSQRSVESVFDEQSTVSQALAESATYALRSELPDPDVSQWRLMGDSASVSIRRRNNNSSEVSTVEITEEDVDRAMGRHKRPSYWRLIGRRPSNVDWYFDTWAAISAAPFLLRMAVLLSIFSGIILIGLTDLQSATSSQRPLLSLAYVGLLAMPFLLGLVGSYFSMSLALAAGESRKPATKPRDSYIERSLLYFSRWSICLFAGPIWLFLATYCYWLSCGELSALDWFILADFSLIGAGYWFAAVLSVEMDQRLLSANPSRVMETITRLGSRFLPFMILGLVAVAIPAAMFVWSFASFQTNPLAAFALLVATWVLGLYLIAGVVQIQGTLYCISAMNDSETDARGDAARNTRQTAPSNGAATRKQNHAMNHSR